MTRFSSNNNEADKMTDKDETESKKSFDVSEPRKTSSGSLAETDDFEPPDGGAQVPFFRIIKLSYYRR